MSYPGDISQRPGRLKNAIALGSNTAADLERYDDPGWNDALAAGSYTHAIVLRTDAATAQLKLGRFRASLTGADMKWTLRKSPAEILSAGDIAYVKIVVLNPDGTAKVTLETGGITGDQV